MTTAGGGDPNRCERPLQSRGSILSANWPGRDGESLVWLASYPRSGNTFARILLANYFLAGDDEFDINELAEFCPADTSVALWRDHAADFSGPGTPREIWEARPKIFGRYRKTMGTRPLPALKTHTGNILAYGAEGFDIRPTDRVLYLVRHPLDVAVSFADYNGKDLDAAIDELCTAGAYARDDRPGAFELRGSWAEHVTNWLLAPPCPLLPVRYETLRAETAETLRTILGFLGAPIVEHRVARAVEASRFEKLREQEAGKRFKEAPDSCISGRFFRRGESLQWLRALSREQAHRLAEGCGGIMQRVGYTHPRDVFSDGRNALGASDV